MLFRHKLFLAAIPFLGFFFWFDIWALGTILISEFTPRESGATLLFALPYVSGGFACMLMVKAFCDWSTIRKLTLQHSRIESHIATIKKQRGNISSA